MGLVGSISRFFHNFRDIRLTLRLLPKGPNTLDLPLWVTGDPGQGPNPEGFRRMGTRLLSDRDDKRSLPKIFPLERVKILSMMSFRTVMPLRLCNTPLSLLPTLICIKNANEPLSKHINYLRGLLSAPECLEKSRYGPVATKVDVCWSESVTVHSGTN